MTQTVILYVKKDTITVYNRFPWKAYQSFPLWKRIYYWMKDHFIGHCHPFCTIHQIAEVFPTLQTILPTIKVAFKYYPTVTIKLTFTQE